MSVLNENQLLGAPASTSQYQIQRSLRFNSADSAYLSRTPASAGNRKTWTWSGWVKKCSATDQALISSGSYEIFGFQANGTLRYEANSPAFNHITTAVFRDSSAWMHVVLAVDTTQATASNRVSIYVNNTLQALSTASYPSLNADTLINGTGTQHIGVYNVGSARYVDGYLADIHFIDGQALTPASFGETDATTGQWIPKAYTGTYGTNGFKLNFSNNSAATATTLGADSSGNGNNWTPNNLSVTAGAGNDSLVDTPTSYGTDTGVGGEVRGNYCTLNPLDKGSSITLSNGNLDYAGGASSNTVRATFQPKSGKWYWEASGDANTIIGISASSDSLSVYPGDAGTSGRGYNGSNGASIIGGGVSATWATFTSTDVIGLALDVDAGTCAVYKNNSLQGTWTGLVNPVPAIGRTTGVASVNFGQRPFAYTAPSGFKALCDTSLPAPTIVKPSTVMDVKLYTGNGGTQTISGLGFESDLLWIKRRDGANSHQLTDSVRGLTKYLFSDATLAEETRADQVTATSSTGFSVGSNAAVNANAGSYAAWCWDAGSSTVTNTAGTIQSSVRANASAGFSVVTFTASSSGVYTWGHGLGVAPQFVIVRDRNTAGTSFGVFHASVCTTTSQYLTLNSAAALATQAGIWGSALPTSSVVSLTAGVMVTVSSAAVAYCFAPVAGYSAFGSYTGNGSADGPFVFCNFRPRWIMVKRTTSDVSGGNWIIKDALRNGYNDNLQNLYPNLSAAEQSFYSFDILSNGFKVRSTDVDINGSAATYIYAAFAEAPFQYARAR